MLTVQQHFCKGRHLFGTCSVGVSVRSASSAQSPTAPAPLDVALPWFSNFTSTSYKRQIHTIMHNTIQRNHCLRHLCVSDKQLSRQMKRFPKRSHRIIPNKERMCTFWKSIHLCRRIRVMDDGNVKVEACNAHDYAQNSCGDEGTARVLVRVGMMLQTSSTQLHSLRTTNNPQV